MKWRLKCKKRWINDTKIASVKKINKIDKPLAKLTKRREDLN
jgi:hypothetical protein